jgi:hypothetical protein
MSIQRRIKRVSVVGMLTDFGLKDHYVGVMKGVMLSINPQLNIIDLSHDIEPHDVMNAYFLLQNSYRYFPKGTIFVVVIDPGVGSQREIICVLTAEYTFLAPDNGILSFLYRVDDVKTIYAITNRKYFLDEISATFHGRDIFAPVAAHLSLGLHPSKLGEQLHSMLRLGYSEPKVHVGGIIDGEVISIDRFGNLITNISSEYLQEKTKIELTIKGKRIEEICKFYDAKKAGELVAIIGSSGNIEVSVTRGNAAKKLRAKVGDRLQLVVPP